MELLIEPLSEITHVKIILIKRFLTFLAQIQNSNRSASKFLLESILHDTNSTTGSNLRNILLKTDKSDVIELVPNDAFQLKYHQIEDHETWKVPLIKEIIETKQEQLEIFNFTNDDIDEMLNFLCTSYLYYLLPFFHPSVGFARGPPPVPTKNSGAFQI